MKVGCKLPCVELQVKLDFLSYLIYILMSYCIFKEQRNNCCIFEYVRAGGGPVFLELFFQYASLFLKPWLTKMIVHESLSSIGSLRRH